MTELADRLAGYTRQPVVLGRSGAEVYRLVAPGKPTLFVKKSEAVYSQGRRDEAARLGWLKGRLPVPDVVFVHEGEHGIALVTAAIPGVDLTHFNDESPEIKRWFTRVLAGALRRFHAVDPRGCPFDHSAAQELGRLEAQLSALELSTGETPDLLRARQELTELRQSQPEETLVLTHGDACLPNVLVQDFELSGFVDLGAAGLGDRWRDLERACWSLTYNYGGGYDEVFLEAYGETETDRAKLDFYRGLEWFSVSA